VLLPERLRSLPLPLLQVHNLTVSYLTSTRPVCVVRDISFQLSPGETLALVGETGCGKTSVALSLIGLLNHNGRIESGEILFEDLNLLSLSSSEWRRIRGHRIGMIFQDMRNALNPVLTVGEHLIESLLAHQDMPRARARARCLELMAEVGFPDPKLSMRRFPFELSGGMCQRLGIALGICNRPSLLIADEPTSSLDSTVTAHILELLQTMIHRYGSSLILISHDLPLVFGFADRVAVMYHGRLVERGSATEIFGQAAHPYTRALIKCLPTFDHSKDRQPLAPIPGAPPLPEDEVPGCAFAPRCPEVEPECVRTLPACFRLSETHEAACLKVK